MNDKIRKLKAEMDDAKIKLQETTRHLQEAILETAEFKVGDIVVVVTPAQEKLRFRMESPEMRLIGQVKAVSADIGNLCVHYEIAKQTKSGFHSVSTHFVSYGDRIEKYDGK